MTTAHASIQQRGIIWKHVSAGSMSSGNQSEPQTESPRPRSNVLAEKTLPLRNYYVPTTIGPRGPEVPRCLLITISGIRNRWETAPPPARVLGLTTQPPTPSQPIRAREMAACGACSVRTPNESESDACRHHCTGAPAHMPCSDLGLLNRTACGSRMSASSSLTRAVQMIAFSHDMCLSALC